MVPYDEQQVSDYIDDCVALYEKVGRKPDPKALIWLGRMVYDTCDGLGWTASRAKHLEELRIALGGTPPPAPAPDPSKLTVDHARQIVFDTAAQFPELLKVFGSDEEATSAASELLEHTMWNLTAEGFSTRHQRNPSGVISGDKLDILIDGQWQLYDIFSLGFAGRATVVQFVSTPGPNPV